jgi:diguanylate cyclase (GGDEF)-like protein/PAS domain S-box-containing protein
MASAKSVYALLVALLVAVFLVLPDSRPVVEVGLGLAAVGAVEFGLRRFRPQRAGAWRCLQLALGLLAAGDAVLAIVAIWFPTAEPDPALSKVFYLAVYPVLTVALLWLGRAASRHRDDTTMLDTVILTLSGGLIVWIILVRPYLLAEDLSTARRAASIVAWLGYVTVLAASLQVLRSRRRNTAATLLAIAVFAYLVAEIFYGYELLEGVSGGRTLVDLGYVAFTALCGAAALQSSMRDVPASGPARQALSPWLLTTIVVALLLGPTVLLVEATRGVVLPGVSIAIIGAIVGVLLLFRLRATGRAYQRRTAREHASREASGAMVAAITLQDVLAGIRSALHPLVHDRATIDVELADPYPPEPSRGTVEPVSPGERGKLALRLARSDAALIFAAAVDDLDDLGGLLRSLGDQAALALERIRLAGAAEAEERDRYFRTLVLTSTDVILISRDGRIDDATPSAQTLFGRDVLGERVEDIAHPCRPDELKPTRVEVAADRPPHPDIANGTEATIQRHDAELTVVVDRRDLTDDPTVRGIVTTMRDVTAERALQRDLAYRASHDQLTGLANVRAWDEGLTAEDANRRGPGHGIAVMAIDLDNFKRINDHYGHQVGDGVLAEVARRIRGCLRAGDLAARVGGDEFAALLRGLTADDHAHALAQRLIEALTRPARINSIAVDCRASVGLSYSEGVEPVRVLVRQADNALYVAKDQGRGRWTEYTGT